MWVPREMRVCELDGCGNSFECKVNSGKRFCSSSCVCKSRKGRIFEDMYGRIQSDKMKKDLKKS